MTGEWRKAAAIIGMFLVAYLVPFGDPAVRRALAEGFAMLHEYAREHVLFCLVPAFFIAGAIANFVSQGSVVRYFGPSAKRWLSYSVASVSGSVLAVCSCTVLPLFSGIYRRGAGLGPAVAFLYSGPAINVLAVILTARVLGWQLGLARAVGSIAFAAVIGLLMHALFRREEEERSREAFPELEGSDEGGRSGAQNLVFFLTLVLILVFTAWGRPAEPVGFWMAVYRVHWPLAALCLGFLGAVLYRWFDREELAAWTRSTWGFAAQILPLLFAGVLAAGFFMGRPGTGAGLIPSEWVAAAVGGNSVLSNLAASVVGALMYFATLTEVPILQGLIGSGMGKGPALALLLAGPAVSLPNLLVINGVLGPKKTATFALLVVGMATVTGLAFGAIVS